MPFTSDGSNLASRPTDEPQALAKIGMKTGVRSRSRDQRGLRNTTTMFALGPDFVTVLTAEESGVETVRHVEREAESAHETNLITFHRVKNFPDLIYCGGRDEVHSSEVAIA